MVKYVVTEATVGHYGYPGSFEVVKVFDNKESAIEFIHSFRGMQFYGDFEWHEVEYVGS